MNIIGVILECNPFHNGHKYFLSKIDKKEDDILIAIISGAITQRGEVSVLDKKIKTKLLLENRVDLVISLPSLYANQGGQYFAYHALNHLKKFNINKLYFGSESNDLNLLKKYLKVEQNYNFKQGIHNNLQTLKSNDILGISYLRALNKLKMNNVEVKLIKRITNEYNESNLTGKISSATSIRNNLTDQNIIETLPKYSYDNILNVDDELMYKLFLNNLHLTTNTNVFLSENRELINKFRKIKALNLNDFINKASDKNNSKNKIRRVIINIILQVDTFKITNEINYIQVLGFNKRISNLLKNELVVFSLKNLDYYEAQVERQCSNLLKIVSNSISNDDFNKPIIF